MDNRPKDKINKEKRFVIPAEPDFKKKFKQYCTEYNVVMSERIRVLIEMDMENSWLKSEKK